MFDPDAPIQGGFHHWVVFDIPANVFDLESNAGDILADLMPQGAIQSITDFGTQGYGGPCPPEGHGLHQYMITIHALKVESLNLDSNTNPALVEYNLWLNGLAKASIVFYYQR